jgi:hypothetical protein
LSHCSDFYSTSRQRRSSVPSRHCCFFPSVFSNKTTMKRSSRAILSLFHGRSDRRFQSGRWPTTKTNDHTTTPTMRSFRQVAARIGGGGGTASPHTAVALSSINQFFSTLTTDKDIHDDDNHDGSNFLESGRLLEESLEEAEEKEENQLYQDDDDDLQYSQYDDYDNDHGRRFTKSHHSNDEETGGMDDDSEFPLSKRLWLDPKSPIKERVNRFVNTPLGTMHHLDIKIASIDLIRQCGKLHSFEGMKYAQDILDRLIEEKRHVNAAADNTWPLIVVPDRPFQYVMYGWANLCKRVPFASQRMREVLDLMIQEATYDKETKERVMAERTKETNNQMQTEEETTVDDLFEGITCEPTVATYNTLLQGLTQAATRSIQAAIEAEEVLSVMDKMHQRRGWHTKPNTRSYSLVLNAYAKCNHNTAGERAENVLREMIHRHEQEMEAYHEDHGKDYDLQQPEKNRRRIVTPDAVAYTSVIQAHGNSQKAGAAEKALVLLSELIHSDNPAVQADAFAFANTINVFSKMAAKKASPEARTEAAVRAEEIWWLYVDALKKKKKKNQDTTNGLTSSIVPFNAALKSISNSFTEMSPHLAEELLFKLLEPELHESIQLRPDTVSFNTVMQAWANASKVDKSAAPERAEELLKLLKESSMDEDYSKRIYPNVQSYVVVMNAYAVSRRNDSVFHVHRLLTELLGDARKLYFHGDEEINAVPFTVLLKAIVKSNRQSKEEEVAMEDPFGVQTNEAMLARTADPYTLALETYSELKFDVHGLGVQPDHFAFAAMLDVIAVHTDPESVERRQRISEIFEDACQAGQVSSLLVRSLQNACPNEIVLKGILQLPQSDFSTSIESVNVFPRQWTRFVPPQFRRVTNRKDHFHAKSKSKQRLSTRGGKNLKNGSDSEYQPRRRNKQATHSKDHIF